MGKPKCNHKHLVVRNESAEVRYHECADCGALFSVIPWFPLGVNTEFDGSFELPSERFGLALL